MKRLFLMVIAVCSFCASAQKKPGGVKKPMSRNTVTVSNSKKLVLAKVGEVAAEQLEKKNGVLFYALAGKDTLFSSAIEKGAAPSDVKITPVSAGSTKLHSISWNQKKKIGDPKAKLENITESHTEIWNAAAKKRVFENTNSVNNITEIVWLDPNKTASKTVEKVRREGMECSVSPQGDVILKNKTSESRLAYDAALQKFVAKK